MISILEKVIILKTVPLFSSMSDNVLAQIAVALRQEHVPIGETLFEKGDIGNSMYIIVSGEVKAHDKGVIYNLLNERDVFGEMAALDPAPRSASITATRDTLLLRLERSALHEIMDTHYEVGQAIIEVLSRRLRERVTDVSYLNAQLAKFR